MHTPALQRKHLRLALMSLALALITVAVGLWLPRGRSAEPAVRRASARLSTFPRVILWAWERPETLDFIDTRTTGVAYLARTLQLRGDELGVRPRLQPLRVPPATMLVAVVRIESDRANPPRLSPQQRAQAVNAITELSTKPGVSAIQIDFDATLSERDFYRALLFDVRRAMPDSMPLSMTALASWCMYDDWLGGVPVDEAVPMLFRMGVEERGMRAFLASGGEFRSSVCRASVGVSTDEPLPLRSPRPARVYVFHPQSWTPETVRHTLQETQE